MRATIAGVAIEYQVHGEGDPVLLVHGFPLSSALWDGVVERLKGEWRFIVPDLRGHGRSESSAEASMARYADDLVELLDLVGEAGRVPVVALSMGGYVAFELYRRHPERVRALVLVDTRATLDTAEGARTRLENAERVLREGSGGLAEEMTGKLFATSAPPELRERWREIMAASAPRGVAAALRAMAVRADSTPTLREIRVPTLVVVGAEDAITPPAEAHAMAEVIPGAELRVIPGAGHMTPAERPDDFSKVLSDFLRRL